MPYLFHKGKKWDKFKIKDSNKEDLYKALLELSKAEIKITLLGKFKLSEKQAELWLLKHPNLSCDICGKLPEFKSKYSNRRIHLDHDHKTNEPRGILCPNCNHGLGMFKDDVNLFYAAINYIRWSRN